MRRKLNKLPFVWWAPLPALLAICIGMAVMYACKPFPALMPPKPNPPKSELSELHKKSETLLAQIKESEGRWDDIVKGVELNTDIVGAATDVWNTSTHTGDEYRVPAPVMKDLYEKIKALHDWHKTRHGQGHE